MSDARRASHTARWSERRGPARVACGAPYYVGGRATHRPRVPGCGGTCGGHTRHTSDEGESRGLAHRPKEGHFDPPR